MDNFVFSKRSKTNLQGVHPALVWVCARGLILSPLDFICTEGLRSRSRQHELVQQGKSKTYNSKHLKQSDGWGHAFDVAALVNGTVSWDNKHYKPIADAMKQAASELGVRITWGGDWKSFVDTPHFQLDGEYDPSILVGVNGVKIANTSM